MILFLIAGLICLALGIAYDYGSTVLLILGAGCLGVPMLYLGETRPPEKERIPTEDLRKVWTWWNDI